MTYKRNGCCYWSPIYWLIEWSSLCLKWRSLTILGSWSWAREGWSVRLVVAGRKGKALQLPVKTLAEMRFLRRVTGSSLRERLLERKRERGRGQLWWFGHLYRTPPGRLPREGFRVCCPSGGDPNLVVLVQRFLWRLPGGREGKQTLCRMVGLFSIQHCSSEMWLFFSNLGKKRRWWAFLTRLEPFIVLSWCLLLSEAVCWSKTAGITKAPGSCY